jgi:hypothetical protein
MGKPGPKPKVTADDVEEVFRERDDPHVPLTAPEVADRLDVARRTALDRLGDLADDGRIDGRKVGGRAKVWYLPLDALREVLDVTNSAAHADGVVGPGEAPRDVDADSTRATPGERAREIAGEGGDSPDSVSVPTVDDDTRDAVEASLASHNFPGSKYKQQGRIDAVAAVYAYLKERPEEWIGRGGLRDVVDKYDPEHGYKDVKSFWNNYVVKDANHPNALTILPGVEGDSRGYRFAGGA